MHLVFVKYGWGFVTFGAKKDSFGFCHIWVGFVTYGVSKDTFVFFFKYGLGFVTYGVKKVSFGFGLIWIGFVTYGVSKDTFGFCQIWVRFFHLSGQRRYTRDLSNMAWGLSLMG